jgi:NAD-dependent dihydropyrimidine dehydrogenase PreA subunit
MIELVSDSRCIRCDICVKACPTNVFDAVPDAAPVIARQSDCQTCFMCELYCPVDALFVAPEAEQPHGVDETGLSHSGLLGSYREAVGWGAGRVSGASRDQSFRLLPLAAAAAPQRSAASPATHALPGSRGFARPAE